MTGASTVAKLDKRNCPREGVVGRRKETVVLYHTRRDVVLVSHGMKGRLMRATFTRRGKLRIPVVSTLLKKKKK